MRGDRAGSPGDAGHCAIAAPEGVSHRVPGQHGSIVGARARPLIAGSRRIRGGLAKPWLDSLTRQLTFLKEIDRLKTVTRQSPLLDRSRKENSAEHSWHLAMYAWLPQEYASGTVDISRVMRMLLLHDIVEVDVGDTPIHGAGSAGEQAQREAAAAARLFGLLPQDQGDELLALWEEFEAATTDDAKFAKALDRFQPLLVNIFTEGGTWAESGVSREQVLSRYGPAIRTGAPRLWAICEKWVIQHGLSTSSGRAGSSFTRT